MKAALGVVSAGGAGTPSLEVTHNGDGPSVFVAVHPLGNAGAVTASKVSPNAPVREGQPTGKQAPGVTVGVGEGTGVGIGVGFGCTSKEPMSMRLLKTRA